MSHARDFGGPRCGARQVIGTSSFSKHIGAGERLQAKCEGPQLSSETMPNASIATDYHDSHDCG